MILSLQKFWRPLKKRWWRTQARTSWGRNPVPSRHSSKGLDRYVIPSLVEETRDRLWSPPSTFANFASHGFKWIKCNASGRHFPSVLDLPDLAWPLDPAHCVPVDIHSCPHSRISRQNSYNAGESSIGMSLVFQMYQKALDESTQYTKARWIAFVALNTCFLLRIVLKQACSVLFCFSFYN